MRVTRETLLKLARETAAERVRLNSRLVAVYLTGSILTEDPWINGTTDVDLIFIHASQPLVGREIIPITPEIHLDIAHLAQEYFIQPRRLRTNAWIGPFISGHPLLLHDSAHWFEFTQAAISAQINQPETILERARSLAAAARRDWWAIHSQPDAPLAQRLVLYLKSLENAANALAVLNGVPLTERRFILNLVQRTQMLGRPELAAELVDLLQGAPVAEGAWDTWMAGCKAALTEVGRQADCPARLLPARRLYYVKALDALYQQSPAAGLWLLLNTWTRAAAVLLEDAGWNAALEALELSEMHLPQRLEAADAYLDRVEEALDAWGAENGLK